MGGSSSKAKTKVKRSVINESVMNVSVKFSTVARGSISGSQVVRATNGGNVSGNTISQINKLQLTSLAQNDVNAAMQSALTADLKTKLETTQKNENALPLVSSTNSSTTTTDTLIKNVVATNFGIENYAELNTNIIASQIVEADGSNSNISDNRIDLQNELIATQTNALMVGLAQALEVEFEDDTESKNDQSNSNNILGAFFSSLMGMVITSAVSFVICLAIVGVVIYLTREQIGQAIEKAG